MDVIKKIKNYTLNERHCLGQGSFGKVYQGQSDEGRKVAIKKVDQKLIVSDPYLRSSLDNQIIIMQKLKHPNIVELYEVVTTANNIYLVMEFCSGGDLKRYCMGKKINEEMAFNIIRQITKGFEEMSRFGVIHRDLKPANILIHQEVFKICDFGFARFFGEAGKMARTCVGTPIYMSPQVLKQKHYTQKTDIWSLGVLFYELLFSKLPYNGYSQQDLYRNIMKGPLNIPDCSKQAQRLLSATLVIDQQARWAWADVFEFLGKNVANYQKRKPSTPGVFYRDENALQQLKLVEKKNSDPPMPPIIPVQKVINYFSEEGQAALSDRMRPEAYKLKPRNMLAVHKQLQQVKQNNTNQDKEIDENPRFLYFIFVQFLVNPLEGSLSFDSFLYSLWKHTVEVYEKLMERNQVTAIPLYKRVLQSELIEVRAMEKELRIKKQGNLRKLGQIVFNQAKNVPENNKRIVWLKRYLDKKYTFQCID